MKSNVDYFLTESEKREFAAASQLQAYLKKKSPNILAGWQKRLFVIR